MQLSYVALIHTSPLESPRHQIRTLTQSRSATNMGKYLIHVWISGERLRGAWEALSAYMRLSSVHTMMPQVGGQGLRTSVCGPWVATLSATRHMPSHLSLASDQQASHGDTDPAQRDWALSLLDKESSCLFTQALEFCIQKTKQPARTCWEQNKSCQKSEAGGGGSFHCHLQPIPCLKHL